eukprot:comp15302_c0_seq1/m.12134 comp15302_c0_seq1/g.12134  ORF comp15302_c0_seq1/g.12134 comp15302_c0_seq1/m.12134 type:complete len:202 (-) comp15302_c0_seq1:59-664(-)
MTLAPLQALLQAPVLDVVAVQRECERIELEESTSAKCVAVGDVYTALLLAYLTQNHLDYARFLWKRIPDSVKAATPALAAVWQVGACMWAADYAATNQALAALPALLHPDLQPLAAKLTSSQQERTFALIGRAYATISISEATNMLGCPLSTLLDVARQQQWGIDEQAGLLHPVEQESPRAYDTGLDQLRQLTDYVMHLEK